MLKKCFAIFLTVLMCLLTLSLSGYRTPATSPEGTGDNLRTPPKGMVLIPAGKFQMGSNDAEARNDEQPVCTVSVDAFYMDATEVTNAQYQAFLIANPHWQKGGMYAKRFAPNYYLDDWNGNDYPSGKGNHPVVWVSWYAAMVYSKWIGKRLPTEAEWERAARGGLVGNKYPHGNTLTLKEANYLEGGFETALGTTPVGTYPPNAYGLYDMAGNVWEWCLDAYAADFYLTFPREGVARNPLSGANSVRGLLDNYVLDHSVGVKPSRVLRGGSWRNTVLWVRVAARAPFPSSLTLVSIGFRCARSISP